MVLDANSNLQKRHEVFDDLSLNGWMPLGSYQGDRIMARGHERIAINPMLNLDLYFARSERYIEPREFMFAYDIEEFFASIVLPESRRELKVPCLYDLPLVKNWRSVLDSDETVLDLTEIERRRLATIKVMPEELKYVIWKAYAFNSESHPEYMKLYRDEQKKWFDRSAQLLRMRNSGSLSKPEYMEHYFKDGSALDFRVDFALKNPDWMEIEKSKVDLGSANIREPYEFAA